MLPGLEWRCKHDIAKNIKLPNSSSIVINEHSVRLCYIVIDQNKPRYITLPTRLEAAKFFVEKGIIFFYRVEDDVKLFIKTMVTSVGEKGVPVQHTKMVEIGWCDLKMYITQSDVIRLAVDQEYEEKGRIAGILTEKLLAKVIHLSYNINQAA